MLCLFVHEALQIVARPSGRSEYGEAKSGSRGAWRA